MPAVPEVPGTPLPAENVTRGTLFALLALPAGVLVWGVVASFDFISGWIAIGIAIFALWLYRKGSGGRIGFNGAARVAIISIVTLIIAYVVGIAVGYPVEFSRALSRGTVIPLIGAVHQQQPPRDPRFPGHLRCPRRRRDLPHRGEPAGAAAARLTPMADAGYSGTPQLKKLGIVRGARWDVDDAPPEWAFEVAPDPAARVADGAVDVVVAFVRTAAAIAPALDRGEKRIFPAGGLWIAWPRKAAGHVSDVDENAIRDAALARRLVDVKVAALDQDWSALKLVWRKEHR